MKKKILSLIVCVMMMLSLIPSAAFAEEPVAVEVKIVAVRSSVPYDGAEHSGAAFDVQILSDPSGEFQAEYVRYTGEPARGTDAGSYKVPFSMKSFQSSDERFNLKVTSMNTKNAYLDITAIPVNLEFIAQDQTVVYDGQEHRIDGFEMSIDEPTNTLTADDISYVIKGEPAVGTGVGVYKQTQSVSGVKIANPNYKLNVTHTKKAKLTVEKATIFAELVAENVTRTYNGEEQTVSFDFTVEDPSGIYDMANFSYTGPTSVSGTDAGVYPLKLTTADFHNTDPNFKLDSHTRSAKLTIQPADVLVDVIGNNEEVTYNGEEHSLAGYTLTVSDPSGLYSEEKLSISCDASVSGTDAGEYVLDLSASDFRNTDPNFNLTVHAKNGRLVINPAEVTVNVTANSDELTYDGEEHSLAGYSLSVSDPSGLYSEEMLSVSCDASVSGTDAGEYELVLSAADFQNTDANFRVAVVTNNGRLVILPAEVTVNVTANSDEVTYDGEEHSLEGYSLSVIDPSGLYSEEKLSVSSDAAVSGTEIGDYDLVLSAADFRNTDANFNVAVRTMDGRLTIKAAPVIETEPEAEPSTEPEDEIDEAEPADEIAETEPAEEIDETEPEEEIDETEPEEEIAETEPEEEIAETEPEEEVAESEPEEEIAESEPEKEIAESEPEEEVAETEPEEEIDETEPEEEITESEPEKEIAESEPEKEIAETEPEEEITESEPEEEIAETEPEEEITESEPEEEIDETESEEEIDETEPEEEIAESEPEEEIDETEPEDEIAETEPEEVAESEPEEEIEIEEEEEPAPTQTPVAPVAPVAPVKPEPTPAVETEVEETEPEAAEPEAEEEIEEPEQEIVPEQKAEPELKPVSAIELEEIENVEIPMAAYESWSLINLICAILTAILSAGMILFTVVKKQNENEQNEELAAERENAKKIAALSLIPAAAALLIFLLTENMNSQMALVNHRTILMAALLLLNMVLARLARSKKEEDRELA